PRIVAFVREAAERLGLSGQEVIRSGAADYFLVFGALSLFSWVGTARIIRSQVLAMREADFVLAARAAGASAWRIVFVHMLPNVVHLLIVGITASLGSIALSEVALSWLGIGIQAPRPSFGRLIAEASSVQILDRYPHLLLGPGLIVALLVFAFNLLGDSLNDVVNPRRR
ncbi:MAG TPA: ABC transporter permease subunit, partial [Dehalococcoidia bacterium]|nr:ABC transporter permease subunit [Dehalococcoidia bacterium]